MVAIAFNTCQCKVIEFNTLIHVYSVSIFLTLSPFPCVPINISSIYRYDENDFIVKKNSLQNAPLLLDAFLRRVHWGFYCSKPDQLLFIYDALD